MSRLRSIKIVMALGFLILLGFFSHLAVAQDILPKLVKTIQPAVVTVFAYDSKGKLKGQGSGFFINQEGHFVTNYHVLKEAHRSEVETFHRNFHPVKEILAEDQDRDLVLAVISPEFFPLPGAVTAGEWKLKETPNQKIDGIASLKISNVLPEIGERVVVVGSPMGLEQTLSEGVVSAIRKTPPFGEILQITAPISRGSSGSPVVNMKGEVVGIATFLLKEGQNLNFAIPGGRALALKAGEERPQPVGPFFPLSDSQKKSIEAKSLIEQAEDLHDKGEHEKAISVLKQAIRLNPHDPLAHYDLGTICLHIRRYQEAVASFKQAINLEPDYAEAYVNMAVAYRELKQYRKAIAAVKQAINMEPDLAEAHNTLGVTYEVMGRYREAEVAIKQAIRLAPDNPKAHLNLGVVYARQGLHQESIREYQQAIKLKPDYVLAHYNLGGAYLSMGNTGAALEQYKILKNLDPDRANGLFNRIYK